MNTIYNIFISSLLIFLLTFFISTFYKKSYDINKIQSTSNTPLPRLGGFIFLTIYIISYCTFGNFQYFIAPKLLFFLPLFLLILIDDIYQNIPPKIRLFFMIVCTLLFFFNADYVITIDNHSQFQNIFVICLSLIVIMNFNGNNMIDGVNGLMLFTVISQLLSIIFIVYSYGIYLPVELIVFFVLFISLLLVNFPKAKIFMGDVGAYFFSLILQIYLINLIFSYNVSPYLYFVVFSYTLSEVTFSIIRKLVTSKNPLFPDNLHLHIILFRILKLKYHPLKANYMTTVKLISLWVFPLLSTFIFLKYKINIFFLIGLSIIFYLMFYFRVFTIIKRLPS